VGHGPGSRPSPASGWCRRCRGLLGRPALLDDVGRCFRDLRVIIALDGLKDLPRCGRPRRISALERAAVVALALLAALDVRTGKVFISARHEPASLPEAA
jgi:hypothetical protein